VKSRAPLLATIAAALVVAALGRYATAITPWYLALKVPSWKPPDILFGPAWAIIFGCSALAVVAAWRANPKQRHLLVSIVALNAGLGLLWSLLFFRAERPDWALAEIVLLYLSIIALIVVVSLAAKRASWLLSPYIVWVTFAALLNQAIVQLNAPFSGS